MNDHLNPASTPDSWVGFELSVLRRLKFRSAALPFSGEPYLGVYLKRWGVRLMVNDLSQWSHTKALAFIENNSESLEHAEVEALIDDAYVPSGKQIDSSSSKWFNETDALWLNNVRSKVEDLASPYKKALALCVCMAVGDYVRSFDDDTRHLRQPLSLPGVFRRAWRSQPLLVNNAEQNKSSMREARAFIAEQHKVDLMLLRLPRPRSKDEVGRRRKLISWREEWLRGTDSFWQEFDRARADKLGSPVETRQQYISFIEEMLQVASHVPTWAIAHIENGFLSTDDLVETINHVRKVDTVFIKDFSELSGARASIITA